MGFWKSITGLFSRGATGTARTAQSAGLLTKLGWKGILTTIFTFVVVLHAITSGAVNFSESKNYGDLIFPVLWEVGGRYLSADEYLFQTIDTLKRSPEAFIRADVEGLGNMFGRVWDKLYLIFDIFSNFWFIFINFKIWHWIMNKINDASESFRNGIFAILIMGAIQVIFSLLLLIAQMARGEVALIIPNIEQLSNFQVMGIVFTRVLPFKGMVALILFLPHLFNGIYDKFSSHVPPIAGAENITNLTS